MISGLNISADVVSILNLTKVIIQSHHHSLAWTSISVKYVILPLQSFQVCSCAPHPETYCILRELPCLFKYGLQQPCLVSSCYHTYPVFSTAYLDLLVIGLQCCFFLCMWKWGKAESLDVVSGSTQALPFQYAFTFDLGRTLHISSILHFIC